MLALACTEHDFTAEDAWAVAMAAEADEAAARELQRQRDEDAAHRLQAAEVRRAQDSPVQVPFPCLPGLCTPAIYSICLTLAVAISSGLPRPLACFGSSGQALGLSPAGLMSVSRRSL